MKYEILETLPSDDYELIDSGEGEKLERYGDIILRRPDPQALWKKRFPEIHWNRAGAFFSRSDADAKWHFAPGIPRTWQIRLEGLSFVIRPTAFKHTGLFPEHTTNWRDIRSAVERAGRPVSVLNLFGYTGAATLAAAAGGAAVCHVDGSKVAVTWARENAEISGLKDAPIRWIIDDARVFLKREIKRGRRYDAIILDPPAFGHGPSGELWKIEDDFVPLLEECKKALTDSPLFLLVNGYASGYSAIAYKNNLEDLRRQSGGTVEIGELTIKESGNAARNLPCGIFARWNA